MVVTKNDNNLTIKRPYKLQKSELKVKLWFRGLFEDKKTEWSNWTTIVSFMTPQHSKSILDNVKRAVEKSNKTDIVKYRIIKEIE